MVTDITSSRPFSARVMSALCAHGQAAIISEGRGEWIS